MKKLLIPVIVVLMLSALHACIKIQSLPPEPSIRFTDFTVFDTTDILGNEIKGGRLKFYFEDGDGDIGLPVPSADQLSDSVNLFFTLYRKTDGVIEEAPANDPLDPSDYRIPYMSRPGQNKILKGTISITFLYFFYSESDTVKYNFFLKDRAGNESNTATTAEIPVFYDGVYK